MNTYTEQHNALLAAKPKAQAGLLPALIRLTLGSRISESATNMVVMIATIIATVLVSTGVITPDDYAKIIGGGLLASGARGTADQFGNGKGSQAKKASADAELERLKQQANRVPVGGVVS